MFVLQYIFIFYLWKSKKQPTVVVEWFHHWRSFHSFSSIAHSFWCTCSYLWRCFDLGITNFMGHKSWHINYYHVFYTVALLCTRFVTLWLLFLLLKVNSGSITSSIGGWFCFKLFSQLFALSIVFTFVFHAECVEGR